MSNGLINHLYYRLHKCFQRRSIKRGIIGFVIAFVGFGVFFEQVHFIKSSTDSLPQHYFVQLTKVTPKKGDLTLVYNQFYGRRLIKKIIGHEGDRLHQDRRGNLWVGGYLVGKVYPQTAKGQKFTPTPDQVIPKGRVFLHSPHPQSFDSRFQEVGLVHANDLEGRLIAVM